MPTDLDAPKTITTTSSGAMDVPTSRVGDAGMTQSRIKRLIEADDGRGRRRALVKGLVDGNPPYQQKALVDAGRADQCNVNWRESESYLGQAVGAFYDVFSEVPTYATVTGNYGSDDQQAVWGRIVTDRFHYLLSCDDEENDDWSWDYQMQVSQHEMVLYGNGPLWFNDTSDWRPEASLHAELKVPEMAKSTTKSWEEAARLCTYLPHELYARITNEKAASDVGWDVEAVKRAIMNAHPKTRSGGEDSKRWEWHQQRLKNQAFEYSAESSVIETAHYFVREFPTSTGDDGGITQVIVLLNNGNTTGVDGGAQIKFLYKKEKVFKNWRQLVHPMYYANDGGGYHHSVTGMGVKMYSAMEFKNRLLCNAADKAFSPKIMFKPTSAQVRQQLNIVKLTDYAFVPNGFDIQQIPTGSFLEEPIMMNREISRIVASNLSQYRQELRKEDGNPATATQIVHDAQQQAKLGKTQLSRYYKQMDALYNEMYKRASSSKINSEMPGGRRAKRFQQECLDAGVPRAFFENSSAKATRVTGQGSDFMRQQSLEVLLGLVAMLPEGGRQNLIQDVIAARAGQSMVKRYFPMPQQDKASDDHRAFAMVQVGSMKDGVPAVVTGNQNHVVFAQTFLEVASQGIAAAAQGKSNPAEAIAFVELAGPAIMQHIDAMRGDKSRAGAVQALEEQWEKLAKATDQLSKQLQETVDAVGERRQMQSRANAMQNGSDPEMQLKMAESREKIRMQQEKTDAALRQKEQKHQQQMRQNDVKTAQDIAIKGVQAQQQQAIKASQVNQKSKPE